MASDPVTRQLVLFGGAGATGPEDRTWLWEGDTWRRADPSLTPPPRAAAALAFDESAGHLLLFGGIGSVPFPPLTDTWSWEGGSWRKRSPKVAPRASGGALGYDGNTGKLVFFGGTWQSNFLSKPVPSLPMWTWNGSEWTESPSLPGPPARSFASLAWHRKKGALVLFGGQDQVPRREETRWPWRLGFQDRPTPLDDTWVWNGSAWSSPTYALGPSARWWAAMAYDPLTECVELFGGTATEGPFGGEPLGDMWSWGD